MNFITQILSLPEGCLFLAAFLELCLGRFGALPLRLSLGTPFFRLGRWCERRLNRRQRSARARLVRGLLVMAFMIVLALIGAAITSTLRAHVPVPGVVDLGLLILCFSAGRRWRAAARVVSVLRTKEQQKNNPEPGKNNLTRNLRRARRRLGFYTRRDMVGLDDYGLCRMAIEVMARAIDRGFLAALFWYLVAGHQGLWLMAMTVGVARSVGMLGPHIEDFGLVAARCEHVMMLIPAWFGMVFWHFVLLLLYPKQAPRTRQYMHQTLSPMIERPDLWLCGFFAGIFDLALLGPRSEAGQVVSIPWLGTGSARVTPYHVQAVFWLVGLQLLFWIGMLLLFSLTRQKMFALPIF